MNSIQILNGGDSEKLKRIWGLTVNSQVPFWTALSPEKEKKINPKLAPLATHIKPATSCYQLECGPESTK